MNRRRFLQTALAATLASGLRAAEPIDLPAAHRESARGRKCRIVVQHDVHDLLIPFWKRFGEESSFGRFAEAVFAYTDEPGSQIDALWLDIGGSPLDSPYPSQILPPPADPLVKHWLGQGIDWVERLVKGTRERKREVFWNHRICEVEFLPGGGKTNEPMPLKLEHPDWVTPASWWPQGMWNLAAPGLRAHKLSVLRELVTKYDLDGLQIDFSRHLPCLPVGHQWELREHVTEFMRMLRTMTLAVAEQRARPLLLAAKVPQTVAGCHLDGFDVETWSRLKLIDILTLGSRTMDVDVEGLRAAVGPEVQLQPCFDDHHATDGYRYGPIEFLRGVFANHWQRGADSVVTFNWQPGPPELMESIGYAPGPLSHRLAYREVGDPKTMAGKDKFFAVERCGGYPWADGFFSHNDTAPLPLKLAAAEGAKRSLHIADAGPAHRKLRCILFGAEAQDAFTLSLNGAPLPITQRDPEWKDAQIFSPKPQPTSGYAPRPVDPEQRLLRIEAEVPRDGWRQGVNEVEIRAVGPSVAQLEKVEAWLRYA
jgi:hypothetical protein